MPKPPQIKAKILDGIITFLRPIAKKPQKPANLACLTIKIAKKNPPSKLLVLTIVGSGEIVIL